MGNKVPNRPFRITRAPSPRNDGFRPWELQSNIRESSPFLELLEDTLLLALSIRLRLSPKYHLSRDQWTHLSQ
jgi:hypothetical protein